MYCTYDGQNPAVSGRIGTRSNQVELFIKLNLIGQTFFNEVDPLLLLLCPKNLSLSLNVFPRLGKI